MFPKSKIAWLFLPLGVIAVIIFIWLLLFPTPVATETHSYQQEIPEQSDNLELEKWIKELALCESSNNPLAVNPKDKDSRPKYGLYQFDIETWKMYIKRYELFNYEEWEEADWWNAIYSDHHQEIVLKEMIKNNVDLEKEFGCVKKIGKLTRYDERF